MINIVIVGVGGQGTLLTSKLLGDIGLNVGYDVRVSEVHGMSQRGGSVITYVRLSNDTPLYSPLVEYGEADIVLAFESLEALRALPYLKKDGKMIVNSQEILPMPVIVGAAEYPKNIIDNLHERADVKAINATEIASDCGTAKAANVVLLGVLSKLLPFSYDEWIDAIKSNVKPQFVDINIDAFNRGRDS